MKESQIRSFLHVSRPTTRTLCFYSSYLLNCVAVRMDSIFLRTCDQSAAMCLNAHAEACDNCMKYLLPVLVLATAAGWLGVMHVFSSEKTSCNGVMLPWTQKYLRNRHH